jgi:hypothetical protein
LIVTGELPDRLRVFAAYEVQPLSYETVRSNVKTLAGRDDRWAALLAGPEAKPFPEVLYNPLMLTLAATAKLDPAGLSGEPNNDARFVLKAFLARQLSDAAFAESEARRWLTWIARFLRPDWLNAKTTFYLEDLTPPTGPRWLRAACTVSFALGMGLFQRAYTGWPLRCSPGPSLGWPPGSPLGLPLGWALGWPSDANWARRRWRVRGAPVASPAGVGSQRRPTSTS